MCFKEIASLRRVPRTSKGPYPRLKKNAFRPAAIPADSASGRLQLETRPVEVARLAEDVVDQMRSCFADRDDSASPTRAAADLRQVLPGRSPALPRCRGNGLGLYICRELQLVAAPAAEPEAPVVQHA